MYNSDYNKCKEEPKKERKEDNNCVTINIFCNDKKKEHKNKEDDCGCKDDKRENERKEDNSCVTINVFCNDCKKDSKKDDDYNWKDDKKENTCATINIFCEDCKKNY